MPERIYLPGYDDLRKVLKEVGDIEGSKELKAAGHAVASEIVVPGAQARAAGLGALEQKAAATLKAARIDTGGAVRFGAGFAAAFGAAVSAGASVIYPVALLLNGRVGFKVFAKFWYSVGVIEGFAGWATEEM